VRAQVLADFEALGGLAAVLDEHTALGRRHRFHEVVEEFRVALLHELNYELEASNLVTLGRNLTEFPRIIVRSLCPITALAVS
jgi:predicted unusual protein kinase regulating ubiquinone biosynthesis (AarF/ABC1/UbiB family)